MRIQVAALLLCLVGTPSHALTFSTSGPGLAPCGDQMCVDVNWSWGGSTTDSSGQIALVLPIPDPEAWELSSGYVHSPLNSGHAYGWFDPLEVAQVPYPLLVGRFSGYFPVLGANGEILTQLVATFLAYCHPDSANPAIPCGDYDLLAGAPSDYSVVPGDAAFLGPLTLRYDFYSDLEIVPLSEDYNFGMSGTAHLIYDSVIPEPGTGLLVMTGLLGLAYRQRRSGRAANLRTVS